MKCLLLYTVLRLRCAEMCLVTPCARGFSIVPRVGSYISQSEAILFALCSFSDRTSVFIFIVTAKSSIGPHQNVSDRPNPSTFQPEPRPDPSSRSMFPTRPDPRGPGGGFQHRSIQNTHKHRVTKKSVHTGGGGSALSHAHPQHIHRYFLVLCTSPFLMRYEDQTTSLENAAGFVFSPAGR